MSLARVEIVPALVPVFAESRGTYDYRWAKGGRGSGKSYTFALMAAIYGYAESIRILCTRELQVSIKESFHAEVKRAIESHDWLAAHYDVGVDYIRGKNGTEFIFRGLRHNMTAIKSMANIGLCIVEEAEDVPESSWEDLTGTIREPNAEIWAVWNPKRENSPVDARFVKSCPARAIGREVNYTDNPWLSDRLKREAEYDRSRDPSKYAWKWLGKYLVQSDAQVFKNWSIEEFEVHPEATIRQGADWGFSVDPTVLVQAYIVGRKLYVPYEAYKVGCEIVDTPDLFFSVPDSEKWTITADSARPETISHMQRNGFPKMMRAIKGAKSVEEGIEFLKSFDIVVHPRCKHLIEELTLYKYKEDELTGKILPVLADKDNHVIDALRYACEGARRASKQTVTHDFTQSAAAGHRSF